LHFPAVCNSQFQEDRGEEGHTGIIPHIWMSIKWFDKRLNHEDAKTQRKGFIRLWWEYGQDAGD
jgi:hypothetical protein